jgi:hypothetical protein
MRLTASLAVLLPVFSLLACAGDSARETARRAAHRDWCIAEELAVQANAQISTMDTLSAGNDLIAARLYPFAKAFYDFAKAREMELALLDSAAAAETPDDSTQLAARAAQASPQAPAGDVETNAARDYQRRFAEALGNPSHPCHAADEE